MQTLEKPTTTAKPKPKRSFLWSVAVAIVSVVLSFLALEMFFAFCGLGEGEIVRLDKVTGFAAFENKHVTWRKEGFGRGCYNSSGFNDVERSLQKPPGTTRIAVVGDSLTEAIQVDPDKNFCYLLEQNLNSDAQGKHYEVLNCGSSAYNVGQMYLRMKDFVFKFHPDVVVLPIRVDAVTAMVPCPTGGITCCRPDFDVDKNGNLVVDYKNQNAWRNSPDGKWMESVEGIRRYSRTWSVVGSLTSDWNAWWQRTTGRWQNQINKLMHKKNAPAETVAVDQPQLRNNQSITNGFAPVATTSTPAAKQPASSGLRGQAAVILDEEKEAVNKRWLPAVGAVLKAMNADCKAHNCKFMMVRMPMYSAKNNDTEQKLIEQVAAEENIPYMDVTPAFSNRSPEELSELYYVFHFKPAGHKLVAEQIEPFVRSEAGAD
jgi:lysophospholipase L1-like esterase